MLVVDKVEDIILSRTFRAHTKRSTPVNSIIHSIELLKTKRETFLLFADALMKHCDSKTNVESIEYYPQMMVIKKEATIKRYLSRPTTV